MLPADHYLPPPVTCERLATLAARAGGTLEGWSGGAATRVESTLPVHATEEVRNFFRGSATVVSEPDFVARLPGGRVFGSGNVLSADGRTIARDVSWDFGRGFEEHWLLSYKKIRPPVALSGTVAVVATTLGAGYSHWLLEEWPRLLALGPQVGGAGKLIAHTKQPCARAALALHGWRGEVIDPGRSAHYVCEQLVVPSMPGSEGRPTPGVVARVREFVAPWSDAGASPGGERIYITREQARRRRVANEADLWAQLEARGFVKLRLEALTWREQIHAFRRARVVVAAHGAGLANLVFCEAGTRVVEFFNRAYVNGNFWRLAALRGLDYRPVVAAGAEPLAQIAARGREDIVVEVAAVMRAV